MLHTESVDSNTFELLKTMMANTFLDGFFLVGGTNIALRIGHRKSIDLDLFSDKPFDTTQLKLHLKDTYAFETRYESRNTLKGEIRGVFVDCMSHQYPLVKPVEHIEGVRMASLEDVVAMKLNAIVNDGTRIKDFIDVAYLSSRMSLGDMCAAHCKKYNEKNEILVRKGLCYFQDIEYEEPLLMYDGTYRWRNVEKRLAAMVLEPNKVFPSW